MLGEALGPSRRILRARPAMECRQACVLGDVDLVQTLGLAGICAAVFLDESEDPARFSRYARDVQAKHDHWTQPDELVSSLLAWAGATAVRPALYYQADGDLLLVSRHRDRLGAAFRFVLPAPALVEDLVDKGRFAGLAQRLGLPVPNSTILTLAAEPDTGDLTFPLILKPVLRRTLLGLHPTAKALRVSSVAELVSLWPRLRAGGASLLAQEIVPGDEHRIESYHAYVDTDGYTVAEFTGAKIRTLPREFGHSTALRTTRARDVLDGGRSVVAALGARGVLKIDYKRDLQGNLWLLEINPRFSLWHHLGAAAGVNIPALVHADLMGQPRPPVLPARSGVTWCDPWKDMRAAAQHGLPLYRWLAYAWGCQARAGADPGDWQPYLRGMLWPRIRQRLGGSCRPRPT